MGKMFFTVLLPVIVCVWCCVAYGEDRGNSKVNDIDFTGAKGPEDECIETSGGSQHSLNYRTRMRDLDKEYQQGGLTKTEYIQRKREIEKLYD